MQSDPEVDDAGADRGGDVLLVVCTANVCRSPLSAGLLADGLAGTALRETRVLSRGTRAASGSPICETSATLLPQDGTGAALIQTHRAEQATPAAVLDAALIVAMERAHRSDLVRLAPGSQAKVFTLKEATVLGQALVDRGSSFPPDLAAVAAGLHGMRGLVPLVAPQPPRRWWRPAPEPVDPFTIEDGHGGSAAEHEAAVVEVRATTESFVAILDRLTRPVS